MVFRLMGVGVGGGGAAGNVFSPRYVITEKYVSYYRPDPLCRTCSECVVLYLILIKYY